MAQPMAADKPTNSQLKAMFRRIKFSTDSATELVTGQGINFTEEIKTLTQYRVTRLCSIVSKPGGGTDGNVVSNPTENIFLLLVYYFQHQDCVTQETDHSLFTLANLRSLSGKCELEKDRYSTITEYVKPVFKDMPKTFKTIK